MSDLYRIGSDLTDIGMDIRDSNGDTTGDVLVRAEPTDRICTTHRRLESEPGVCLSTQRWNQSTSSRTCHMVDVVRMEDV
ncbi:MAG: hypothetical protein DRQ56_10550 [Gammaproteobacteria bacterium]|nr:MAG: hypothetical protein DRQ56_10550 [Gammaproteobacteria bacterium]